MRTEVKVVAILAFVLIVVGVWWFMFHSPQGSQVATNEPTPAAPSNVVVTESGTPSSVTPAGSAASRPTSAPTSAPSGAVVAAATPAAPAAADGGRWWERTAAPAAASAPTRVTAATPAAGATSKPSLADTGTGHSYKVKTGDTYWSIAKAEYGDGNLHTMIEKANPKVPANRLAANLTITIPAKPAPAAAAATPAAPGAPAAAAGSEGLTGLAAEGTTGTDPATGKKYYIVKKGDNGLWAIAQNTLGDGKLWTKIKAANEGLQETNLHPGQKLWLPQIAGADAKIVVPKVSPAPIGGTPSAVSAAPSAAPSTVSIPGLTPAAPSTAKPTTPSSPAAHVPNGSGAPASTDLPGGKAFD